MMLTAVKNIKNLSLFMVINCFFWMGSFEVLADLEIPLLGENASLNLQKETELGEGLYNKLKETGYVIDDPLLSRYLQDIGESLLSGLDVRFREYHFYLVKDGSINAFAAPGGYIGVNAGLIAVAESEDELASVLAHEIAHVELMHSMQMYEKAKTVNVAGMVSVLAAILLSGQNPEAASAVIYTSMAGSAQSMINFTRANEYEADRVGVELLKKSGYAPAAMANFMKILQSREQSGELAGIEYLRTHPVNSNRIAEITSRVAALEKKQPIKTRYQQFKDYLFYLIPDGFDSGSKSRFSIALEHTRNGRYEIADKMYHELIESDADSLWYNYALAENMEYQNRLNDASQVYQSALLLYPNDIAIGARLVNVLRLQGRVQEALEISLYLLQKYPAQPKAYQLLVDVYANLKNEPLRQLAEANYQWYSGNKEQAKRQFKALISNGALDASNEAGVKEKLDTK